MNVQQQIMIGRTEDHGAVRLRTAASTAGLTPEELHAHEELCGGWSDFVPGRFERSLVHVPLPAPDGTAIEAHVVARVRSVELDGGPGVSIHLVRTGPAAFAALGDDPYRLVRTGHLLDRWTPDTAWPEIDVDAIGEDRERGLRAVIPEQYPVLEALLRHALADGPFVLDGDHDDAAIEDLFEHVLHLLPRSFRQRTSFASFVPGPDTDFDIAARRREGSTFRASLRALLTDAPPALDSAHDAYVQGLFEDLRDGAWGRAGARIESFDAEPVVEPDIGDAGVAEAEADAVESAVVEPAIAEPDIAPPAAVEPAGAESDAPEPGVDAPEPGADAPEPTIRFAESGPVTPVAADEVTVVGSETADPAPEPATTTEVEGWGEVELDDESPSSGIPSGVRIGGILLVVLGLGAGAWFALGGSVFGGSPDSRTVVDVDPLEVGVRADLAAYVDDQFARIDEHRSTQPPRFEFRQTLSRRRAGFERQLESTLQATARALDGAIAGVLASPDARDSTVAELLRAEARAVNDLVPRLRRLHAGLAAGRPELLRRSGAGSDLPSSAADSTLAWAEALTAWAGWFEQPGSNDVPPSTPTDGFVVLAASLEASDELSDARARERLVEIWGALPVTLRDPSAEVTGDVPASDEGAGNAR